MYGDADDRAEAGPSSAAVSASKAARARYGGGGGGTDRLPKQKLARSKAACDACHKAKQRCDGPPGPCHRCTTWGIDCQFPSAAGPVPSARAPPSRSATPTRPPAARGTTPTNLAAPTVPASSAPLTTLPTIENDHPHAVPAGQFATPDVAEQLKRMNERLESLESALTRATTLPSSATPRSSLSSLHHHARHHAAASPSALSNGRSQAGSESSPMTGITPQSVHITAAETHRDGVGANAVETAGEAMAVEGLVDLGGPQGRSADNAAQATWESVKPDVLGRGILSLEECDAEFDFYFENIQPWSALLSTALDRHPLVVRERSPLLFHAILLLTLYYRPRTPANVILYRAVSSILDSILAPQILCPQPAQYGQPDQLSFDFVRAVHLLLLYKPVQYSALNARGISDPAQIESASKMNIRASWMLRLLVSRVSAFIGLPSVADRFAQAFANQHHEPIPEEIIAQQRLYLGCVFHESHGALQSGKTANFTPQDACRTTRLFAQLRRQPSDVRLAASVELVAHAATALNSRVEEGGLGGRAALESDDLQRFDDELEAWQEYWAPLLASAQAHDGTDPVAWSLWYPYASFARLNLRGAVFHRWKADRKLRATGTRNGQAMLDEDERESIAIAAQVAQEMMLAITVDGEDLRSGRTGARVEWRSDTDALVPDPEVVRTLRWASDSLTCVMFSFPVLFLAKVANEGLLRPDLTVIDAGTPPLPPLPMSRTDRLCRLFQLGADLLDAIAPNPHHPSVRQAAFLRKVLEAAISGRRSITSAPSSPNFGPLANGLRDVPPLLPHAVTNQLQTSGEHQRRTATPVLAPATVPPPPEPTHPRPLPSAMPPPARTGSAGLTSFSDFSLAAVYQPTPTHSPPPLGVTPHQGASPLQDPRLMSSRLAPPTIIAASTVVEEDPFAALLSGVSPSMFDDAGQSFFALDTGIDWASLGGSADGSGPANSAGFPY